MRRRVRRRVEAALDRPSLEIDDHHVVGLQRLIVDAAGLDGEDASGAVDRAGVAEGEVDEAVPRQGDIGLEGFALEFREQPVDIAVAPSAASSVSGPEALGQTSSRLVVAQVLLEAGDLSVPSPIRTNSMPAMVGEVLEHLGRHAVAKAGVMRAAREDPGRAGRLEVGLALPDRAGDRKFRQRPDD